MREVASLFVSISLRDTLTSGLRTAERETRTTGQRISGTMQSVGQSVTRLGTRMFGIGSIVTAAFGGAINQAVQFESAFAGVIKTVDATDEQLAAIRQTIRDMATDATNPVAGIENAHIVLAQIMEAAGQLGVGVDYLTEFTQVMGELSLATDITAQDAAVLTAQFANVTGMDFTNVRNFGSTIVALGNNSATTESAILAMASRLASAGTQAGLSEDQILGFSAALSSAGITAELGGSNFSRFLGTVALAAAQGGDDLTTFATIAGMTANDFSTLWGTDATAAILAFIGGLSGMDQAAQLTALDELGLSGTEMTRVITSLAGNTDLLTNSLNIAGDAWTANSALATEANARLATTEAQMNVTKNQIRDTAITIGEALLPAFNNILQAVQPIITSFGQWASENPQTVQTIATVAVAVTGLGAVLIPLGMAISAVGTVLGVLSAGFGVAATAIGLVLSPIGLVIAAGAALGVAIATDFGGIRTTIVGVFEDHIIPAIQGFLDFVGTVASIATAPIRAVGTLFMGVFNSIRTGSIDPLITAIQGIVGIAQTVISQVEAIVGPVIDELGRIINDPLGSIGGSANPFREGSGIFRGVGDVLGVGRNNQTIQGSPNPALNNINVGGGGGSFNSSGLWNMVQRINQPPVQIVGHAAGGYPRAGMPVVVGERGPELASFPGGTRITPNHEMGGAPSIQIGAIYANSYEGGQAAARGLKDELEVQWRAFGNG